MKFNFILVSVDMEEKNRISFDYWCTTENGKQQKENFIREWHGWLKGRADEL